MVMVAEVTLEKLIVGLLIIGLVVAGVISLAKAFRGPRR